MAKSRNSVESVLRAALSSLDLASGPVAIAFSGGLDSSVLLYETARLLGGDVVIALHVNHRLQPQADDWVTHCGQQAEQLGVGFKALNAQSAPAQGESIEAWARDVRYRLLLDAALECKAVALLTAHHADDQLETFLMALARGSGLDGLSGIASDDCRQGVRLLRPLLSIDRSHLLSHAQALGLQWIEDPTNADESLLRNAVRAHLMPVLRKVLPDMPVHLHDFIGQINEWRKQAHQEAQQDLDAARCEPRRWQALNRRPLAALSPGRQALALREWLHESGCRMPSRDRLDEMLGQLLEGQGAHARVEHDGLHLMRHRDLLMAISQDCKAFDAIEPMVLRWEGQSNLELACGGQMVFEPMAGGLSRSWLSQQALLLAPAQGGARLRVKAQGRARSLKNLWQEAAIPVFVRNALPAVWVQDRVLMAAPFGTDCSSDWPRESEGIVLRWVPSDEDPRRAFNNLVK
jgi:tRNA(Ile)-lysidine synthase